MKSVSEVGPNLGLSQTQPLMLGDEGLWWAVTPAGGCRPINVANEDVGSHTRLTYMSEGTHNWHLHSNDAIKVFVMNEANWDRMGCYMSFIICVAGSAMNARITLIGNINGSEIDSTSESWMIFFVVGIIASWVSKFGNQRIRGCHNLIRKRRRPDKGTARLDTGMANYRMWRGGQGDGGNSVAPQASLPGQVT